jgi:hypothetical protein
VAKCDLDITLDEPNRTFEPGDRVTGRVIVDVDKSVRCDGLTVTHLWKTHGRGNTDRGEVGAETLFTGEWESGRYEYEFDFEQPPGPQTYHGENLNVDWYVHVTADIPWALDPDSETDHLARYTGSLDDYRVGHSETVENAGQQQRDGCVGCSLLFGGLFVSIAILLLAMTFLDSGEGALFEALVFLGVGGVMSWFGAAKFLAQKKLGDVSVELTPTHLYPGEDVRCVVTISPPKSTDINRIRYTLTAQEVVIRGSGTDKRTYEHELHEDIKVNRWNDTRTLQAGGENTFEQTFTIPENAAPSFDSGYDNKLEWAIQTEVDIPNWPDWSTKNVMIVVPGERGSAGDAAGEEAEAGGGSEDWW